MSARVHFYKAELQKMQPVDEKVLVELCQEPVTLRGFRLLLKHNWIKAETLSKKETGAERLQILTCQAKTQRLLTSSSLTAFSMHS